jgi:iron(III) transport system permease protein
VTVVKALRRHQEILLTGAAAALLAIAIVVPLVAVAVAGGPSPSFDPTDRHRGMLLLGWFGRISDLMAWTCAIAASVTFIALAVGVPLGIALGRFDVPGRHAALLLHAFPMFLPPFLLALGWFHLFRRDGPIGFEATARLLFASPGVIFVLALALTPVVTSLVALGARGVDPALEDAARLVARPGQISRRILFPLAAPAATLAAIVVFALSFSELGVPTFLRVTTYPAAVFARLAGIDSALGEAAALALPLVAVALGLLALERLVSSKLAAPSLAWRAVRPPLPLGRYRVIVAVAAWSVVGLSFVPVGTIIVRGAGALPEVPAWAGTSVYNSLLSAGGAATIVTALALVCGWEIGRRRRFSTVLDGVAFVGFVTPAALLGVGLVAVWNRPLTRAVYGSLAIVVIGFVARYAALGVRTVSAGVTQTSASTEEAAAAVGAGWVRRLRCIVAPEQRAPLTLAWILAFVFSIRDLETAVLFYPPGREPLTVRIFTLEANGPEGVVAALATGQIAMTAGVLVLGAGLLAFRRSRS